MHKTIGQKKVTYDFFALLQCVSMWEKNVSFRRLWDLRRLVTTQKLRTDWWKRYVSGLTQFRGRPVKIKDFVLDHFSFYTQAALYYYVSVKKNLRRTLEKNPLFPRLFKKNGNTKNTFFPTWQKFRPSIPEKAQNRRFWGSPTSKNYFDKLSI